MPGKESLAHPRIIQMVWKSGKYLPERLSSWWATAGVVFLAVVFKVVLLILEVYPFNSDEAIVALMARHSINGNWSVFFYGQAYMGSLDASLVALGFLLFGQKIWVIRLVQLILFVGILLTSMELSRRLTGSRPASLVTGMLLAIPTVNINLYTTVSLGGYGEALLIGNLLLLQSIDLGSQRKNLRKFLLWGFLAGLGFWAFGLTLLYTIPGFLFWSIRFMSKGRIRNWVGAVSLCLVGFLIGAAPVLIWVLENSPAILIRELLGSAIANTSNGGYWSMVANHLLNLTLFGVTAAIGIRPPWNTDIFIWPFATVVALFWIAVATQYIRMLRGKAGQTPTAQLLGLVAVMLVIGFIFTPFGGDPSGRYFLPITILGVVVASGLFIPEAKWLPTSLRWLLFTAVLAYQLATNLQVALASETGFTTQFDPIARVDHGYDDELIRFLSASGELRGYSNYWVAYPLAFKSHEQMIFVPRLPYHQDFRYTSRDNRYEPYNLMVEQSERVAYITTNHPELDDMIRTQFQMQGVGWREETIGDYQVFYDLSRPISPEHIDERFMR
jgi:hypothetical protein